jgi:hypothetical protein
MANMRGRYGVAPQSLNLVVGDAVFGHDEPVPSAAAEASSEESRVGLEEERERERVEKYKEVSVPTPPEAASGMHVAACRATQLARHSL